MAAISSSFPSLKLLLISAGVLSIALATKISLPLIFHFALNDWPAIWSAFLSLLRPPYLYVLLNCIIITVAASSLLNRKLADEPILDPFFYSEPVLPSNQSLAAVVSTPPAAELTAFEPLPELYDTTVEAAEVTPASVVNMDSTPSEISSDRDEKDENLFALPSSASSDLLGRAASQDYVRVEFVLPETTEKPLVSARFGHRKLIKANPEGGRALKVAKRRRQETLESSWKMITERAHVPLSRHLKKSDRWDSHGRQLEAGAGASQLEKPEEQGLISWPSKGKCRREPSMSQDELNRRVEAFINKFNEEMRLERQESLNKYKRMVKGGPHR